MKTSDKPYTIKHRTVKCPSASCGTAISNCVVREIPKDGTPTICLHCGALSVYEDFPERRLMSKEEIDELPVNIRLLLYKLRGQIMSNRSKVR